MKIHILTNALEYGDAVSTHCLLLKRRSLEIGLEAILYAEFSDDRMREHVIPVGELIANSTSDDVLLHQLFNATHLMPYVEAFPGKRVLMYHNITPPLFFREGTQVHQSCAEGLHLVRSLTGLYLRALGMSDFTCRDLRAMGYQATGVFPLFVDHDQLLALAPDASIVNRRPASGTTFLFVGRVAPNKGITNLIRFLAAYRRSGEPARLVIVGDNQQHPAYTEEVLRLSASLGLSAGEDVMLTGKIPDSQLVASYRSADAFICLSEHEGFGAPLIESMAFGLPTFAYAAAAVKDTMGRSGVLLRSKDFDEMSATVRSVLNDPAQTQAVIAGQKQRVADFGPPVQREALRRLVEDVDSSALHVACTSRITVVINTYNRARYLERCLESLRQQTCRDFEVVVVNGPSTDATSEVLRRFEGHIRIVETSSRVLSVSRNVGISASSGELIAFIDDDAIADPKWLGILAEPFADPTVGATGGLVYRWNGRDIEFRNGIIDAEGFVRWNEPVPGHHWSWREGYLNTVSGNNCMFRRKALENIGGFDERIEYYHDEADVVMRLQRSGARTVHASDAVVYHEAAPSENRKGRHTLNWRAICKNTIYCALKNYSGPISRHSVARRAAWRVLNKHLTHILHGWTGRQLNTGQAFRSGLACLEGTLTGTLRGLSPRPLYRAIPAASCSNFLPYPRSSPEDFSVCILSQSLPAQSPGGIATYTLNLANGLRKRGFVAHVVSRGEFWKTELNDGIWFHSVADLPVDNIVDPRTHPATYRNLAYSNGVRRRLLDIEARWGLDLVESPNWDAEGLLATLEHRVPVVVRAHTPLFKVAETQGWQMNPDLQMCSSLEGLLIRHAAALSGSTTALLKTVGERFGGLEKQSLVPLGIDVDVSPCPRKVNQELTVLFVGRLEPRKGIQTLLEAIPRVLDSSDNVRFEIAGKDGWRPDGQTWRDFWERNECGRKDKVRFHGEVNQTELSRLYESCDFFVAPSLYESFGLIYLEAMARGKPVIACRAGGVADVVIEGDTGFLVPPGDSSALADAILQLVRDHDLARRLGESGRRRYLASFTADTMAERSLELFQNVSKHWNSSVNIVWKASAPDFMRESSATVLFHPLSSRVCLGIDEGEPRTPIHGPYMELKPGSYRAEFKLWIDNDSPVPEQLGSVDVFSMRAGTLGHRTFGKADFSTCPGTVLDVYFKVGDSGIRDCEFRLHTTGVSALYVRQIVVSEWPPPAFQGLHAETEQEATFC